MSDEQENIEFEKFKYEKKWDTIHGIISVIIPWSGVVACFYFISLMINTLAGKNTVADFDFKTIVTFSNFAPYILAGGTSWWAIRERRLRKKATRESTTYTETPDESSPDNTSLSEDES